MSKFETAEARPINLVHVAVLPPTVYPAPSIFYDWRQDDGYVCNPPCGKGVIEQIRNTLCYLLKVASSTHIRLLSGTTFLLSKKKNLYQRVFSLICRGRYDAVVPGMSSICLVPLTGSLPRRHMGVVGCATCGRV